MQNTDSTAKTNKRSIIDSMQRNIHKQTIFQGEENPNKKQFLKNHVHLEEKKL
jgi:hypothetical protein